MARAWWLVATALIALPASVRGADHPIHGDRIRIKDTGDADRRLATFRTRAEPALDVGTMPDPRIGGAELILRGTAPGDGSSGTLALPASLWTGLGSPSGSSGYVFSDPDRLSGVRRLVLRPGPQGGKLTLTARGANWPFVVTQAQEQLELQLSVGGETWCAQFGAFDLTRNQAGLVIGAHAPAPPDCVIPVCGNGVVESPEDCDDNNLMGGDGCNALCDVEPLCGNGIAEAGEECDDGNLMSGDDCSAACELENAAALCAGVVPVAGTSVSTVRIAVGLAKPVYLTAPRLDPTRLFVVEQEGTVRIIENGTVLPTPFLDLSSLIQCAPTCGERGFLSMAFHPDYESNGRFFVSYTNAMGDSTIARYQVSGDPDVADAGSGQIVLLVNQPFGNHNGGQLAFGPNDGYLYFGLGDGGNQGDPQENGQTDTILLAKMLRLDVDVETPPYHAVPATNPNAGAGDPLGLIWSKGFRNPWRFSFDRASGDLYIGDVGQFTREEIDYQPASSTGGENYGWNAVEGTQCYDPPPHFAGCAAALAGTVPPVLDYGHGDPGSPCAVTGGFVYRGCRMPDLAGSYFFADYCSARITSLRVVGGVAQDVQSRTAELDPPGSVTIDAISSFGEDARGEIYILDRTGEVFQIVP